MSAATKFTSNPVQNAISVVLVVLIMLQARNMVIEHEINKSKLVRNHVVEEMRNVVDELAHEESVAFVQIPREGLNTSDKSVIDIDQSPQQLLQNSPFPIAQLSPDEFIAENVENFDQSTCTDDLKFFDTPKPITALSSFPGSGNTWSRHLLHMATGIWTGNAKSSSKLKQAGWLAEDLECNAGVTIAVKTHRWHTMKKCAYSKVIMVVRNPFYAFIAEFNREVASKTAEVEASAYKHDEWNEFVALMTREYLAFFTDWLHEFKGPFTAICFEELVEDPKQGVSDMLEFMRFPPYRVDCIFANLEGDFHREHHTSPSLSKLFNPEQIEKVLSVIKRVSELLVQYRLQDCTSFFNYTTLFN